MYVTGNPKSKEELRRWLKAGKTPKVFAPGINNLFLSSEAGRVPKNGTVTLEGPHFPRPHRWYGVGTIKDGVLISVK